MNGPYRFHLISLPWTRTNDEHLTCAYTQKCVRFSEMMTARGHEVFLYSGIDNTAACTEHIVSITEDEQAGILGTKDAPWDPQHPAWVAMNARAAGQIVQRAQPTDFLLLATPAQAMISAALPHLTAVEWTIGYHDTTAAFRVFESYAWQHTMYGKQRGSDIDGRSGDVVIPNFFDPADFYVAEPDDPPFFLFIGRGISRKGPDIASRVAEHLGVPLILAGDDLGGFPDYGEKIGPVGPVERAALMARAVATFVPTQYIGPFEGVAVEAMLSGCPVITSDFGAFTDYVWEGDGWRCATMAEYTDAARAALRQAASTEVLSAPQHGRFARRQRAIARFGYDAVAPRYEAFFGRLMELWGPGWDQMEHYDPGTPNG